MSKRRQLFSPPHQSFKTKVKNLFGSNGVTSSSEAGERCSRKNSVFMSVKAGLQFPVGCISRNMKKICSSRLRGACPIKGLS
ncbi:hypothetical protein Bca4012_058651 [Brassica carinata]